MLRLGAYMLAAIAVMFTLTAYGDDMAPGQSDGPPASGAQNTGIDPIKSVRAAVVPDNMGYLHAVVQNKSNVDLANIYVVVVHFNPDNGQPNGQSDPLLVAKTLAPNKLAKLKLEGLQIYKQAELKNYKIIVARAEFAK